MEKLSGTFTSSNGISEIGYFIYLPDTTPRAVIQICHGLSEHIERYENEGFVSYMTEQGFIVCGNDHIGHGSSVKDEKELGHFEDYEDLISDLRILKNIVKKRYPSLPYILLGNSSGSYIARSYIVKHDDVDGVILSGTGTGNGPMGLYKVLSMLTAGLRGDKHKSRFIHRIAFGHLSSPFASEQDKHSFVSADIGARQRYKHDNKCGFMLSALALRELFDVIRSVNDADWVTSVPLSLPVLLISGEDDPISEKGDGIRQIYDALADHELNELKMKIYKGCRHDVLNDSAKEEVLSDTAEWINGVAEGVVACRSYGAFPFGKVDFT